MVTAYKHRLSTGHIVYLANHGDRVMVMLSSSHMGQHHTSQQWSSQQFSVDGDLSEPQLYPTLQGAIITLAGGMKTYVIQCQQGQLQISNQVSEQLANELNKIPPQSMAPTEPMEETVNSPMDMPAMDMPSMDMPPMEMSPMSMGDRAMSMRMGNMSMNMPPLSNSVSFSSSSSSSSSASTRNTRSNSAANRAANANTDRKQVKRFCTQCGASIEPEDKFCGQCGAALR
ncbi:MAG: zinc ribbon domain-containing protein [Cyanobacteria bacterium P01_D01_bin.105]